MCRGDMEFLPVEFPNPSPNINEIGQENGDETPDTKTTSDMLDKGRFSQVYSRRKEPNPGPTPLQSSSTELETEVPSSSLNDEFYLPIALRKGRRTCTTKPLYPLANYVSLHKLSPNHKTYLTNLHNFPVPSTFAEAESKREWREAMRLEMEALELNKTWEIADLPKGKKAVGCRWVYSVKLKPDGTLERYKARLVAKGYTQTYGIDYQETFAPVAKMNTVRVLLSIAAISNWDLQQYDVKNAFLHGNLEEEVYMTIPPGFEKAAKGNKVYRLKKALYGLKQSPRAWFGRFTGVMLKSGYKQGQGDHTLFVKHNNSGGVTVLLVYVDDIIVTGNDEKEKSALKQCLAKEFDIKELGKLKYFLGIEVAHSKHGIFISQRKYVTDLLRETGKLACKPVSTPMEPNLKLGLGEDDPSVDKERYQKLVGKLIYLAHTRPDIAYAVSVVSQFMHDPKEIHLQALNRILHYLKGCPGKGLLFKRNKDLSLEAYTDADYAGSIVDRRSTTGYCTFLGGNLVTWRSKKQPIVARSSAEAEFRALAQGVCELLWLKILLQDLKIQVTSPMKLYCDNKSAVQIAHNPVHHDRTKHIEVDRNFIKEKLDKKIICTPYISSQNQLADVLTKGLPGPTFKELTCKLGKEDLHSPA